MKTIFFFLFIYSISISYGQDEIHLCSFNIQFLGHFKNKENSVLSTFLKDYDIVVVQEMIAPPVNGNYSDKTSFTKDIESAAFINEMNKNGFNFWLSTDDTGPKKNHTASTASEWWIVFYKNNKIKPDSSRFYGFISEPLFKNKKYERVPFAFPFMSNNNKTTFTLVPVHLKPGSKKEDQIRRQGELKNIFDWILIQDEKNKDFIVLGDCNIYKSQEFDYFEKDGFYSLNKKCESTNTKIYEDKKKGKPYDHVFYNNSSKEDIKKNSFKVVNIREELIKMNPSNVVSPYDHKSFRIKYSDHLPICFEIYLNMDTD